MITVGITGIIGSGKTTASAMLRHAGFVVFDLDSMVKEVSAGPEVREDVRKTFGEEFLRSDGTIDVDRMKTYVFSNRKNLKKLEAIVHPRLRAELMKRIARERQKGTRTVVVDGPLIFEKGMNRELTKTVVVSAHMDTIKNRLLMRGMVTGDMERRMSHQMSLEEKEKMADYVIHNNGTEEDLRKEIAFLLEKIKTWEGEDTCTLTN